MAGYMPGILWNSSYSPQLKLIACNFFFFPSHDDLNVDCLPASTVFPGEYFYGLIDAFEAAYTRLGHHNTLFRPLGGNLVYIIITK